MNAQRTLQEDGTQTGKAKTFDWPEPCCSLDELREGRLVGYTCKKCVTTVMPGTMSVRLGEVKLRLRTSRRVVWDLGKHLGIHSLTSSTKSCVKARRRVVKRIVSKKSLLIDSSEP